MQEQGTFQLVMARGPRPGQIFELPRSTVSIGRDPGNRVTINDPQISRQHARITPQGGLMIVEDLGSTNGTTVNGLRISTVHTLAHGDEIGMGDNVTLVFYGWPVTDVSQTVVSPRKAYTEPSTAAPAPAYQPQPQEASSYEAFPSQNYEEASSSGFPPSAPAYEQTATPAYAAAPEYASPEYYDEYDEGVGRNWMLVGLGCLLVAIIVMLLVALFIYFFAPASIVDPIADFLAGLGIDVP
jgi:pSer/pThr/pTyr-binding forkhead associated (FHA) protein